MKRIAGLYIACLACAIAHGGQATGQTFVLKEMNSDNGILAVVLDDTGKEVLHGLVHDEKLDKSTDKQERIALYITSQNSGPGKAIASGGFAIVTSWWTEKGEYIALVHRFRPDEMKPVKAGETPNARVIKP